MHILRYLWAFWAIVFILIAADSAPASTGPEIVGDAAVVINSNNGQTLFEKNPHKRMYPASTTKTLTAIIALENCNLNDLVTVSNDACNVEGSAIGLHEGEKITMEDLLYALMLNSGNDTAIVIANHVGGSVNNFVDLMNNKAAQLGAFDSHFNNPNGLPDPNHYSTAYDLAIIAHYAMKNPEFRKIVDTKTKNIERENPEAQTYLLNHNKMLWQYEGAVGVKTGYTDAAGQCLIAAAIRQNRELIAVVLNSQGSSIWNDAKVLLDYGFNEFNTVSVTDAAVYVMDTPVKYGEPGTVPVLTGQSLTYDFPRNKPVEIRRDIRLKEEILAPVEAGRKLGELVFFTGEREIGRVDLVSQRAVQRKLSARWWPWLLLALLVLVLRSIYRCRNNSRRRYYISLNRRKYY